MKNVYCSLLLRAAVVAFICANAHASADASGAEVDEVAFQHAFIKNLRLAPDFDEHFERNAHPDDEAPRGLCATAKLGRRPEHEAAAWRTRPREGIRRPPQVGTAESKPEWRLECHDGNSHSVVFLTPYTFDALHQGVRCSVRKLVV